MRPFRVEIPEAAIDDLHRRLEDIRWPIDLPDVGWERGVPLDYLQELAEYWRTSYSWRKFEDRLNQFEQFTTTVDGANIHFLHVRSPEPTARAMLITHGWPGSVAEFIDVSGPLTDPRAHGADPADAFHLIVPSMPGFGFSGPIAEPGWGLFRVAQAWTQLMSELGYEHYLTQGADFGSVVSLLVALLDPEHVIGVHLNSLVTTPTDDPADLKALTEEEQTRVARSARFARDLAGSMKIQATRPHTVAYGLTDSPISLLAWIVEKFKDWTDSTDAPEDAVSRDRILDIVSIYWFTRTAGSAAQMYYEVADLLPIARTTGRYDPIAAPLGMAVFPEGPFVPIRRWVERDFPTLAHWSEFDRGGNFAALEEPDLFVEDLRSFGRLLA